MSDPRPPEAELFGGFTLEEMKARLPSMKRQEAREHGVSLIPFTGPVFARAHLGGVTWHRGHHRLAADERISPAQALSALGPFGFPAALERAMRAS